MKSSIPPDVTRLRDQQGASTRRRILRAARELFHERGYAATPVRLLAQQAGVAVQTIYDVYGSKAGIVAAMPDLIDEEADVLEIVKAMDATDDPLEMLRLFAHVRRQIRERCGDMIQILRSSAASDQVLGAAWAEGLRRRRYGIERMMERIGEAGRLKRDLTPARAANIAAALATDEVCDALVDAGGWSFDDYEAWLGDSLGLLLLDLDTPAASG